MKGRRFQLMDERREMGDGRRETRGEKGETSWRL
jgi:hypothetical protein